MKRNLLIEKSTDFALEIINECANIRERKREYIITNQLIRSGTSVGANIREACYAQTTADFITKMQIAIKECSESEYWIELLGKSGLTTEKNLQNHCGELMRLLTASLKTVKEHQSNNEQ